MTDVTKFSMIVYQLNTKHNRQVFYRINNILMEEDGTFFEIRWLSKI